MASCLFPVSVHRQQQVWLTPVVVHAEVEGEYLGEVANRRWPVLIFIFCFDVFCFLFRFVAKWTAASADQCKWQCSSPLARPLVSFISVTVN